MAVSPDGKSYVVAYPPSNDDLKPGPDYGPYFGLELTEVSGNSQFTLEASKEPESGSAVRNNAAGVEH